MHEDRLEVDLRAALHREMASARLGVDAPHVRARIDARERGRRATRRAALAAVAVLAIAVAVPVLGSLVAPGPVAPRPGAVEPATVASLDATSGDLVLSRAWPDGRTEEAGRYRGALDLLGEATGGATRLPDDAAVAAGPDGRLAIAIRNGDVLVFRGPGRAAAPTLVRGDGPGGTTAIGWTDDRRLAIVDERAVRLVDADDGRETIHLLPARVFPSNPFLAAAELLTWAGDGRWVARMSDPLTFSTTIGLVDVTADRPAFVAGLPADVRAITGLEPRRAADGSAPTGWSADLIPGSPSVWIAQEPSTDASPAEVTWYVGGPGERIFDQAWAADHRSLLAVVLAADGRGRLVVASAPGSWRNSFAFDGAADGAASGGPRLRGIAPGGVSVAVSTGTHLAIGDVATGTALALPAGTLFVGWPSTTTVATDALPTIPECIPATPEGAATIALSGAGSTSPASSGALPVMGLLLDEDPGRTAQLMAARPVEVAPGARLVLALWAGTCVGALRAEAIPVTPGDEAPPAPEQLASRTFDAGPPLGGLLGIDAPPVGDWIVGVKLWFANTPGPIIDFLPAGTPAPGLGDASGAFTLLYRVRVGEAAAPSASPAR